MWFIYIIVTQKNKFYTGITKDLDRRFKQHLTGNGAKFFRYDAPLKIIYTETANTRSDALKREIQIKKLSRLRKEALIAEIK